MYRPACPRSGCGQEINPKSVACPSCWRLVPLSIRVDLDACYRQGIANTAHPLWQDAYVKALRALALTVVPTATAGQTAAAKSRRGRRAAMARWSA